MYYRNKLESLQKIFGITDIEIQEHAIRVGTKTYPIREDVIDLLDEHSSQNLAEDIQYTFGEEWKSHGEILPEHAKEFSQYFDLVKLESLKDKSVCDLGCGSGRWSYFLKDKCREIVLIDFSEAIYVARRNLKGADNAIFLRANITQLPLAKDAVDFLFCLGVLHHLPMPCLEATRLLKPLAARQLIFLYYALDNRPFYFRILLSLVTAVRLVLARIRSKTVRNLIAWLGAAFLYKPLVWLGHFLSLIGLGSQVPLYDFYRNKSLGRIQQDVYDRFFTRIEQRVTKAQILELQKDYSRVVVSEQLPYWHFLLER